jgi:DNA polymerase-3 subunit chi
VTEVAFHTNVPDKLGYTCRLLRKAWRQGHRVVVVGESAALGRLDQALWVFEQTEFVPHLRLRRGESVAPGSLRTPIWLVDDPEADVQATVLVNLGPEFPGEPGRFERVVEVVSQDVDDAQAGRTRWRRYSAAGLVPVNRPYTRDRDGAGAG